MAEKDSFSTGSGQSLLGGSAAPPAGACGVRQDALSFTLLDSSSDRVVQPFPRSPKLQRKVDKAAQPSQVTTEPSDSSVMTSAIRMV